MNFKKLFIVYLFLTTCLTVCKCVIAQTEAAGDYIAMPYFGDLKIRFYQTSTGNLFHTLDIADEYVNFPSIPFSGAGPNAAAIYNGKLFISFDKNLVQGGVLIYNFNDIYPVRNSNPPIIISTAPVAGIAIHPVTGDLYTAKFNTGGSSGVVTRYTKISGYSAGSAYDLPVPDNWVNYFTGIAFDESNNLWAGNLDEHKLICYKSSLGYDGFYVIGNGITLLYPAATLTGGSVNVRLLSAPEGFALDNTGNIWVSNNNDWSHANNPGEGTFLRINKAYITNLLSQPLSGTIVDPIVTVVYTIPAASVNVYYRQDAKFGGLAFKSNVLYHNDQGNGNLWKWDITASYINANCTSSGINAAYPGFGGLAFNDITFPFGITLVSTNIPKSFELWQNYPNPFNPNTKIRFDIAKSSSAKIVVYDILGRKLEELVNLRLNPGTYEVDFDGTNYSSGVYFYRLTAGDYSETRKMLLVK